MTITDQQKRFCEEYIIDFNGTRAAIEAGYKSAKTQASRLLSQDNIQEYVQKLISKRSERVNVTADDVIRELAKIAFCDVSEFYDELGLKPINDLSDQAKAAVSSYQTKRIKVGRDEYVDVPIMKMHDKSKALELLGRHFGVFEKDNGQKQTKFPTSWNVNVIKPKDDEEL